MATPLASRPLADLEVDSVLAVEAAWERRSRGLKPWTVGEFLDQVAAVHARYAVRREWLRRHPLTVPCAECPTEIPAGRTYCSSRCRNAADSHDEMDGDL